MKKNTQKPLKTLKKYETIQQTDYITKKSYFIGLIDGKAKTKKYASLFSLLEKNASFKRAFSNGSLKQSKVSNVKR